MTPEDAMFVFDPESEVVFSMPGKLPPPAPDPVLEDHERARLTTARYLEELLEKDFSLSPNARNGISMVIGVLRAFEWR